MKVFSDLASIFNTNDESTKSEWEPMQHVVKVFAQKSAFEILYEPNL